MIKAAHEVTCGWMCALVLAFLNKGCVSLVLKEAIVCPILKKPSWGPKVWDNYVLFGKMMEKVVKLQLQRTLEERVILNPFQFSGQVWNIQ